MRPVYETAADRKNEVEILDRVAEAWAFEPKKLSIGERLDYAGLRGGLICLWLEIKRRNVKRFAYPTLAISNEKISAGLETREKSGLPFYLVIGWDDGLYYLRVTTDRISKIEIGGRRDRGDPKDLEMMAHFDVRLFREVT